MRALSWVVGAIAGVSATVAAAAPVEQGQNAALFVVIVLGCIALVVLRRRA